MNEFTDMAIALVNLRCDEKDKITKQSNAFSRKELEDLLVWLRDRLHEEQTDYQFVQPPGTQRIFSVKEQELLNKKVQALLIDFELMDLITPAEREQIIDQVISLDAPINEFQLRYLTFLVVAQPGEDHNLDNIWLGNVIAEYGHQEQFKEERH